MLELVGATNAAGKIKGTKPMTAEAVIAAQPDVYVLFDSGLKSIGGVEGLLKVPGLAQTPAGRNKRVVAMDGLYLSGIRSPLWQSQPSIYSVAYMSLKDISL